MKKFSLPILIIFLLAAILCVLVSCKDIRSKDVDEFILDQSSVKTQYYLNEDFCLDGIKSYLKLKDGETVDIPSNELSVKNYDKTKLGRQSVKITYTLEGRNSTTYVSTIFVDVVKLDDSLLFLDSFSLNKTYDAVSVNDPKNGVDYFYNGQNDVKFEFYCAGVKLKNNPVSAGDYLLKVFVEESDASNAVCIEKEFKISPKRLNVKWSGVNGSATNFDYKYTGSLILPKASVETGIKGEEIFLIVTGEKSEIGEYLAQAKMYVEDSNYTLENDTCEFNIVKAFNEIRFAENTIFEKTYDNLPAPEPEYIDFGDGVVSIEWYLNEVKLESAPINAGEYILRLTKDETEEYSKCVIENTFVINKADYDMGAITFSSDEKVYNGSIQNLAIAGQLPEGVTVTYSEGLKDVGNKVVTATFETTSLNHNAPDLMQATLTITAYELSVTWSNTELTYNGEEQAPTASVVPLGEDIVNLTVTGAEVNARENYTATAQMSEVNNNYVLTNATVSFKINKANYDMSEIAFSSDEKVYNGSIQNLAITGQLPEGVTVTYSEGLKAVGNKVVTATFSTTSLNHNAPASKQATLTITAYELSVTWSNTELTYNGVEQAPTASVVPLGEDIVNLTVTGAEVKAGENYTATAQMSEVNNNYVLINATVSFKINKADYDMSAIKFDSQTKEYNGSIQNLAISGQLPDGVSVTYSDGLMEIGSKEITATFSTTSLNHNAPASMRATLTIEKRTASISSKTATISKTAPDIVTYDDIVNNITYTSDGSLIVEVDGVVVDSSFVAQDAKTYQVVVYISEGETYKPITKENGATFNIIIESTGGGEVGA